MAFDQAGGEGQLNISLFTQLNLLWGIRISCSSEGIDV